MQRDLAKCCNVFLSPHRSGNEKERERLRKERDNGYEYANKHFDRNVLAKKYLNQIEGKVLKLNISF